MAVKILVGDVFEQLATLPDDYFDVVCTSPPYWGLRDYGTATWVGGDEACAHRSPTMREGRDEARAALAGSVATNSHQLKLAHNGGICGLCGAVKVDAQIGLEPTLGEHLDVMVRVFREVRRVMKPSGVLWLNYGDCYATSPNGRSAADTKATGKDDRTFRDKPFSTVGAIYNPDATTGGYRGGDKNVNNPPGRIQAAGFLKPKDLCMVPNRLAIALQDDGWWVRAENIWAKPSPMPESIKDRPATAHEKVFLLSKSERYGYDPVSVRQAGAADSVARYHRGRSDDHKFKDGGPGDQTLAKSFDGMPAKHPLPTKAKRDKQAASAASAASVGASSGRRMAGFNDRWSEKASKFSFARETKASAGKHGQKPQHRADRADVDYRGSRNLRNYEPAPLQVWPIASAPFSDAHFATFPPELVERCLSAAPKRFCAKCGEPWTRVASKTFRPQDDCSPRASLRDALQHDKSNRWSGSQRGSVDLTTVGFYPACRCARLKALPPYPPAPAAKPAPAKAKPKAKSASAAGTAKKPSAKAMKEWTAECHVVDVERQAQCRAADAVPYVRARVLDPFGGAGTTAMVAEAFGLDCTLIELNPAYAAMTKRRIKSGRPTAVVSGVADADHASGMPLFEALAT